MTSSVFDIRPCPKCGYRDCSWLFWTSRPRDGSVSIMCFCCAFSYEFDAESGRTEERLGLGMMVIQFAGGGGQASGYDTPDQVEGWVAAHRAQAPEPKVESAYYTRERGGAWEKVFVLPDGERAEPIPEAAFDPAEPFDSLLCGHMGGETGECPAAGGEQDDVATDWLGEDWPI
jgi:hypothetical protein